MHSMYMYTIHPRLTAYFLYFCIAVQIGFQQNSYTVSERNESVTVCVQMTTGNYTVPVTRAVLYTGSAQSMYPAVLYSIYTILSHTTVALFLADNDSAWACVSYLRYWHYAKMSCEGRLKEVLWYCFPLQGYVPLFQGILVRQQLFVIQNFLFQVPFTIAAWTFRATLDFINAHLQQQDQVISIFCTVDFWLIVCGDIRVLTVATMWTTSTIFLYIFTTLATSYSVGFVVLGWIL